MAKLLRIDRRYATLAVAIALTELLIACFVRDAFVRPYLGDTLAVILLYAAVRSTLELPRSWVALFAVFVGCALELGQALRLWAWLGLEADAPASIVLGTFYDPLDLIAYVAALPLIALLERLFRTRAAAFTQRAFQSPIRALNTRRPIPLGDARDRKV
jgi:hypothetical protein